VLMRSGRIKASAVLFGLVCGALQVSSASAQGFTAEQATAGKGLYESNCAQCHGFQLEGPDAPALSGIDVMANWATAGGLYDFISVAMPPSAPGQLGDDAYVNIIAYIMSFNGAEPGDEPLTAEPDVLSAVELPRVSAADQASMAAAALDAGGGAAGGDTAVPQAFTWGKQLPGGPAPAEAAPSVPQAFTWGQDLPRAN